MRFGFVFMSVSQGTSCVSLTGGLGPCTVEWCPLSLAFWSVFFPFPCLFLSPSVWSSFGCFGVNAG